MRLGIVCKWQTHQHEVIITQNCAAYPTDRLLLEQQIASLIISIPYEFLIFIITRKE